MELGGLDMSMMSLYILIAAGLNWGCVAFYGKDILEMYATLAAVHAPPGGTRVSALTRRASCADGTRRFEEARDRRRRQGAGEEARAAGELR